MSDAILVSMTYPTLAYSVLLAFCVIYWLIAATGIVDTDAVDGLLGHHHHVDGHDGDGIGLAGILAKLGLSGVPIMLVLTTLSFFGWVATYFTHLLVLLHLPAPMRILVGTLVAIAALIPGVLLTSFTLRPVAKLINRLRPPTPPSILGREGTVISPLVDEAGGRVEIDDGAAGLILQARTHSPHALARGSRVVLIHHDTTSDLYEVIPANEFQAR